MLTVKTPYQRQRLIKYYLLDFWAVTGSGGAAGVVINLSKLTRLEFSPRKLCGVFRSPHVLICVALEFLLAPVCVRPFSSDVRSNISGLVQVPRSKWKLVVRWWRPTRGNEIATPLTALMVRRITIADGGEFVLFWRACRLLITSNWGPRIAILTG